jgi:hypothetical protein
LENSTNFASINTKVMEGEAFSFEVLVASFKNLSSETLQRNEVPMILFIRAYKELIGLFDVLGRAFSFVKTELVEKITMLQNIVEKDTILFESVEKMVNHEVEHKLTVVYNKSGQNMSGRYSFSLRLLIQSRTLLRLVRALEFIKLFMQVRYPKCNHLIISVYRREDRPTALSML